MNVLRTERSFEACAESGWTGYYLHLDGAVDEALVKALGALGTLTFMPGMKPPFFIVQAGAFLIRGLVGDRFVKAGIKNNDAAQLAALVAAVGALPP